MGIFEDDITAITSAEFSKSVTINGQTVKAVFDSHSITTDLETGSEVVAEQPMVVVSSSLLSSEPAQGDPVIVDGVSYTISEPPFFAEYSMTELRLQINE